MERGIMHLDKHSKNDMEWDAHALEVTDPIYR